MLHNKLDGDHFLCQLNVMIVIVVEKMVFMKSVCADCVVNPPDDFDYPFMAMLEVHEGALIE